MMKISIKREQSQAGLSFAEREKFRPQVKNKLLLLLALLLTAATGAWAQTETLLKTITNTGENASFTSGSKTFDDIATVTFSGTVHNDGDDWGWYAAAGESKLLTVAGADGYTITRVKFYSANGSAFDEEAPFEATVASTHAYVNGTDIGQYGVAEIEVYGYEGTAEPAATGYTVSLKDGVEDADKWMVKVGEGQAQALPIGGLKGDGSETVTLQYTGRLKVKGVKATSDAAPAAPTGDIVDLSSLSGDYEAQDGDVLTGETTSNRVYIAAGATVTLDGVNISGKGGCIKCLGDATIILKDGSTNTLTSSSQDYPALSIGDANTTLTIQGSTGVLNVTSGSFCAGIGGGYSNTNQACGNIRIEGGVITAQGGQNGAGIGTDASPATCGDIIITGGTITAKGGNYAAGIGTGKCTSDPGVCGDITIANTVTKVTATAGASAPYSIGKGSGSKATCGTVTIGGTKYWENNAAVNGGDTYLATSPLIYDPTAAAKPAATVTTAPTGAAIVGRLNTTSTALVSGGAAEGGTMMYKVTTENTKPASTDGFSDAVPTAQSITASGKVYVWYYVKGDGTHSDSEIAATAIEVPVADVVWDATNVFNSSHKFDKTDKWDPDPLTYEGITISVSGEEVSTFTAYDPMTQTGLLLCYGDEGDSFTFTAPQGKMFCKIEIIVNEGIFFEDYGDWTSDETGKKFVWSGTAANAVTLGTVYTCATNLNSIGFYLSK